ncbi:hypothetical protein RHGRI_004836 [Rhododendron griersonianum]|uniref:Uncharacterized protein n=1 Tax=Rhododendron griersonianum TaxID=479676 RepID=A0AAV6LCJ5_9ERIC|nr:hypothetical protein RHGRI_004836 [Rhododendron griersonianum]KAG5561926.1 hypothetical protein RHGRI_004836 [Rhododendron griersonianum]KAG5561927.1 hypothetical protein RHGRI_004836 [Rhododendron griersonianum]KAG5561928.1 hypothetical protein RHGRI_004836 [Rhododendron griersonianum]
MHEGSPAINYSMGMHAAFGVMARNTRGEVVGINYGWIEVLSALAAEAWAIRVGCSMGAASWGSGFFCYIGSDCPLSVRMIDQHGDESRLRNPDNHQ